MIVTEVMFEQATGRKPVDDDLERANCESAGQAGHHSCGWCPEHHLPRFECGCLRHRKVESHYEKFAHASETLKEVCKGLSAENGTDLNIIADMIDTLDWLILVGDMRGESNESREVSNLMQQAHGLLLQSIASLRQAAIRLDVIDMAKNYKEAR